MTPKTWTKEFNATVRVYEETPLGYRIACLRIQESGADTDWVVSAGCKLADDPVGLVCSRLCEHIKERLGRDAAKAIINFQKNASEDYNAQHRAGFCPNCEKARVFRTTADYGYCPDCGHRLALFRPEVLLRRAAELMAEELEPAAQAVIDSKKGDGDGNTR